MADLGSLSEVPKPARPQIFFCYLTSLEPKEPDKTFRFDSRGQESTFKSKFLEKKYFFGFCPALPRSTKSKFLTFFTGFRVFRGAELPYVKIRLLWRFLNFQKFHGASLNYNAHHILRYDKKIASFCLVKPFITYK